MKNICVRAIFICYNIKNIRKAVHYTRRNFMNKIGIIGAMEAEVDTLKQKMNRVRAVKKAGMEFCEGNLRGKEIVVVRSGICKVNAAVCTQILIDDFDVEAVINTGIAGSLRNEINIGDIVISTDLVHHDVDARGFGYEPGQIPQMDEFSFKADEKLVELAKVVCEEVNPDIQVIQGRIVSGEQFVSDQAVKEKIEKNFSGFCTEMEGAAIGQTAYLNGIPFVVLRAISDKADGSAFVDYATFEAQAIRHSVRLVENLLERLD